jgi:quercetin dioxygenase-like cupin family protein
MKMVDTKTVENFMDHGMSRISMLSQVDVDGLNLVLAKQKPHTTVTDVARTAHMVCILEGEVTCSSGDDVVVAGPGVIFGFDLDQPREMRNDSDQEVTLLLINPGSRPVHNGPPPARD